MLEHILFALWFFLPAGIANGMPVFAAKVGWLSRWSAPIDGGKQWRGRRLLGPNKTWRGLAAGVIGSILILWLQQILVSRFAWAQDLVGAINYQELPTLLLGAAFGLGALGGDAIESFFKRQRGIASGRAWTPFDQLDYVVGGLIGSLPFVVLTASQYLWIVGFWFLAHLLFAYLGWLVGLKERPI